MSRVGSPACPPGMFRGSQVCWKYTLALTVLHVCSASRQLLLAVDVWSVQWKRPRIQCAISSVACVSLVLFSCLHVQKWMPRQYQYQYIYIYISWRWGYLCQAGHWSAQQARLWTSCVRYLKETDNGQFMGLFLLLRDLCEKMSHLVKLVRVNRHTLQWRSHETPSLHWKKISSHIPRNELVSVPVSVWLSVDLRFSPCLCLCLSSSVCLCLSVCLSLSLSVCLSLALSLPPFHFVSPSSVSFPLAFTLTGPSWVSEVQWRAR